MRQDYVINEDKMNVRYYDESEKLISSTEDYVPCIGEFVTIDDIVYEVVDKKIEIVALHTEIEIHLIEGQHNIGI